MIRDQKSGRGSEVDFPHQFALSSRSLATSDGWHDRRHAGWSVINHPSLPVVALLDKDQHQVGHVLGWPVAQPGTLISTSIRLPISVSTKSTESLEAFIYGFGGRYAFVVLAPDLKRLYLDPGGTLAVVFSEKRAIAGSTVSVLVKDEPEHPLWSRAVGEFPDDRPNQYLPAGLTMDPSISRLLPNHYLDLDSWRAVRHYPASHVEDLSERDLPERIDVMIRLVRGNIVAVAEASPRVYLPLTAGSDSRILLASVRDCRDRFEFVTFDRRRLGRRRGDLIDLFASQRLAASFGLRRVVVPVSRDAPAATELEYLRRIGFAGGAAKAADYFSACLKHLDLSAAWLTGFGGETGKTFFWAPAVDKEADGVSPEGLLKRMGLPITDPIQNAVRTWLHDLPEASLTTLLAFAYLEHRQGCWASPHFYGAAPFSLNMAPFCHREIFDLMLRLPSSYRRRGDLARDAVSAAWPELMSIPFNDYIGTKRLLGLPKQTALSVIRARRTPPLTWGRR